MTKKGKKSKSTNWTNLKLFQLFNSCFILVCQSFQLPFMFLLLSQLLCLHAFLLTLFKLTKKDDPHLLKPHLRFSHFICTLSRHVICVQNATAGAKALLLGQHFQVSSPWCIHTVYSFINCTTLWICLHFLFKKKGQVVGGKWGVEERQQRKWGRRNVRYSQTKVLSQVTWL